MSRDDLYIELTKRLESASNRAAGLICLLIVIECATSWSRFAIAVAFHVVVYPINMLITRTCVPRFGARTELIRSFFNAFPVTLGYHFIGWPIAVWLWLPYTALAFDPYGGRYSFRSVILMCVGLGTIGLIDGVSPAIPGTFILASVFAWDLSGGRLRITRAMLADTEANRSKLAAEIEARKEIENELVKASREAGMAEVATGVLHNVGNVLNSVNVGASLSLDRLRGSRLGTLEKLVALYEKHTGGLVGLLASEKGAAIPTVLGGAVREVAEEQRLLASELAEVMHHIEHIKRIVAAQQTYARVAAAHEAIDIRDAIDSALLIGGSTMPPNVEVVRDLGTAPSIVTDRHKVLQILVNLISNAAQAVSDEGGRITVRLRSVREEVQVEVEDNGVGIAGGDIASIFRHGYTTKPNGHGFGLHTSANSARELGGSLAVASGGVGRGATFTLHLPQELS